MAARQADVERVPVDFYEGERDRQVTLLESFRRKDLDQSMPPRPQAIAEELDLTQRRLAERIDMSVTWGGKRLRP